MIWIRLDGNEKIGLGHLMRMTGLSEEFQRAGEGFRFLIRENKMLISELKASVFGFMIIPEEVSLEEEPVWINSKLSHKDILIVDLFEANRKYLSKLSEKFFRVLVDNLEDPTLPCDLYYHGGNYAKKYEEILKEEKRDAVLGTEYVILRSRFQTPVKKEINESAERLLITMGGADVLNLTEGVVETASDLFPSIDVVIGAAFSKTSDLKYDNVAVHKNVKDMYSLMESADLCVSAGGTTVYELAATGLPAITYIAAKNQISQNRVFHKEGTLLCLGNGRDFDKNELRETLLSLRDDPEKRRNMSEKGQEMVDGKGARRVREAIFSHYDEWRS